MNDSLFDTLTEARQAWRQAQQDHGVDSWEAERAWNDYQDAYGAWERNDATTVEPLVVLG